MVGFAITVGLAVPLTAQDRVPVELTLAEIGHVTEELPLTGTVTARQQAALSPRTSGLVKTVHVDAGDRVTAGTILVSLDATLAELGVQRAEAALAEARARRAESERRREEARELRREHTIAETEARTREAELQIATAAARQLEVELHERTELLARHTVIAPFDGVVTRKLTDAGEWVATGTPVIDLVAMDRARVDVQVPQERLAEIRDDTPVEIHPDARPGSLVSGRVIARVPVSDPAARTALVRVEPADSAGPPLLPGKSVRVVFRLRSTEPVLTVPRDALVRRPDGTINVWVAERAGDGLIAAQRRVDLGRAFADLVEIRAGLESGQSVVVRGNETLRAGQALQVISNP
jgi:membrane fusion protein (multidrug efflux system)